MSHFYGTLQGQAGEATRRGSKKSGLSVTARSYALGAVVDLQHCPKDGDVIRIHLDGGSNETGRQKEVIRLTQAQAEKVLKGELVLKVMLLHPSFVEA